MSRLDCLTKSELKVAELLAWGACKKEIAVRRCVSVHTVENHARNIYEKLECNSIGELSAIWFCEKYDIPKSDSPRTKHRLVAFVLLLLMTTQVTTVTLDDQNWLRPARTTRTVRTSSRKYN
ncbi:MAG: helix-turn-helix transcriptional regulator [Rikenellaceae bacterium]